MDLSNLVLPDQTGEDKYPPPVPGRVAHIDADFMSYQVSAESKDELDGVKPRKTIADMKFNCKSGLTHLMKLTGATSYVAHITPSGSNKGERDDIALTKEYQGNRKGREKPEHLNLIRAYIGEVLPSAVHLDQEADDGMTQANYAALAAGCPELSVIVSKDKDLRMAPGLHWCFDDEVVVDVDDPFGSIWVDRSKSSPKVLGWGTKFFWAQLLMGDTADHIQGLPNTLNTKDKIVKVGAISAHDYLSECTTNWQCLRVCMFLWSGSSHDWHDYRNGRVTTWQEHMISDMKLLWMRRTSDQDDVLEWLKTI
jgi:hypothetical protein